MSEPPEPIAVVDDERFDAHRDSHGHHPERPERLAAARSGLRAALPDAVKLSIAAREATADELAAAHPGRYASVLQDVLSRGDGEIDGDTYFSRGSRTAAWLAAGSAAELAGVLMSDKARRGIALLRPPGHHAEPDRPMGFCLLNNIAVAAHAARAAGAKRVAIVDFDVHHGNGTQAAFYDDPDVLFVSLHQWPLYPGTGSPREIGEGAGRGRTVNLALPPEQGPETYGAAFRQVVLPVLDAFGADVVLVSAGFDAHARDPLAQMQLDTPSFAALTGALCMHAERAGHGRVGLLLEGGYDLIALEESVAAVTRALRGERTELPEGAVSSRARDAIAATKSALSPYWMLPES